MRITKTVSLVSLGFSAVLVLLVPSCGSTTLTTDGGGSAGTTASGAAGTTASGTAGTTGTAGTHGAAGTTGTAGTHGSTDGGAGSGGAGKTGSAGTSGECLCAAIYLPVCGVDGHTYPSACEAGCGGVAIAHAGVCTDAGTDAKDASTDGKTERCDQDSDCTYRQNTCSCSGICVAKTDPIPPAPPYACSFACPAIAYLCGCVNHQCSPAAATGAP